MDNIAVKMEPNCKNKSFLDHIYCHPNDNNYIRANTGAPDVITLVKENKHLKTMLLLHLDLIQEQSDQILSKDKQINSLREENDSLRSRLDRLERKSQLRNNKSESLQQTPTSTTVVNTKPGISSVSVVGTSPTLTVASTNVLTPTTPTAVSVTNKGTAVIGNKLNDKKENIPDIKLIEPKAVLPTLISFQSQQQKQQKPQPPKINNTNTNITNTTSPSPPVAAATQKNKYKICDETFKNDSIIGESNGKFISKIFLQRVQITDANSLKKIESAATRQHLQHQLQQQQKKQRYQQQLQKQISSDKEQCNKKVKEVFEEPELESCEKVVLLEDTNLIKVEIDNRIPIGEDYESNSGEDMLKGFDISIDEQPNDQILNDSNQRKRKRSGFMTTKRAYRAREWEDEQFIDETNKEEAEALKSEAPNLEIPKWSIKEFTGLYSIEGTEDLSDDLFLKRHSKFEHDEKRRKKWDVQRIREQRTIERLRRRHYKADIQNDSDNQEITSFYPTLDQIKYIQITEELPVQAFGDCIPQIPTSEFNLPWHSDYKNKTDGGDGEVSLSKQSSVITGTSHYVDSYDTSTSFIFIMKKKRRLQSQSMNSGGGSSKKKKILTNVILPPISPSSAAMTANLKLTHK